LFQISDEQRPIVRIQPRPVRVALQNASSSFSELAKGTTLSSVRFIV
jgi:hypothetical protein